MAIKFTKSASDHGISNQDALYALTHALNSQPTEGKPGEATRVFVGLPHPQARRYIEVIAAVGTDGNIRVFHVMELSDKWVHLLYEVGHTPRERQ